MAALGRVDLVFNKADKFMRQANFGDANITGWRDMVNVVLNGGLYVGLAAYRVMPDPGPWGGRIINNGSILDHVPRPSGAAYTAMKQPITGRTRGI